MGKIVGAFLMLILIVSSFNPANAQSGKVERNRNIFGVYKYHQEGQKFSEKEFMAQMPVNSQSYMLMQKARKNYLWGNILGFSGGFLAATQLRPANPYLGKKPEFIVGGAALFVAGLHLILKYEAQSGLALDLYNESQAHTKATNNPEFRLGFTGSGIGLQLRF